MTSRKHHLTYFLFFIYLLALPASVVCRTLGCDWLNNPDPNPGKPELNLTAYHASIAPDVPVGTVMLTVSANDTDVNDTLWYFLEDCDYVDFIDLDPSSGELKVISTLMDIYAFEIQCVIRVQDRENLTESEVKTDRADLVIKIYDIREFEGDVDRTESWWDDEYETNAPYVETSERTTEKLLSHTKTPDNKPQTTQPSSVPSLSQQLTRSTTTNTPMTTNKITTQKQSISYTPPTPTKTATTQKTTITYTPAPTTKTTTTQKPNTTYTSVSTTKTTIQNPNITYTPAPTTKTATIQKLNVTYTQPPINKNTTTKKPNVTYTPAPYNKPRTTQKPKPNVGKTTPTTAKPGKPPSGNVTPVPKGGIATKNKTRVVKKVKKPGKNEGEATEYDYEYDYDYDYSEGEEGGDVRNKTSGSGKGPKTGNAKKKKKRVKVGGEQEVEEQSQEYESFEESIGEYRSQEEGSAGSEEVVSSDRGRERGRKGHRVRGRSRKDKKNKGSEEGGSENGSWSKSRGTAGRSLKGKGRHGHGRRHGHGENSTSTEEIGSGSGFFSYSHNGSNNDTSGSYSSEKSYNHKHGYKYRGGKRHRQGENSTSSEEQGSTGNYYSYSYNGTSEELGSSYRQGSHDRHDKRRHGYKYKGGKVHKHGENSTSSEEVDYSGGYYSYSYTVTDEGQNGSYSRGGKERSDKRKHGYKSKGGKRIKHGENSTSSEEADYSGGDYSYSYNGTDEGQDGSYRRGDNERSEKRRHGYKYKGGKRIKHGENSTSLEEVDYSGGYYSYSYNGTEEGQNGSYRRGGNERSDKRRHGYKYKSGKRIKHGENSTSSEEANYSGGDYSYSYNGTDEGQDGSYRLGGNERFEKRRHGYKYKGGKRHKHGENSVSSEEVDYSGGYYSYSYNGTEEGQNGSYRRGGNERSDKRRHGYKYKGGKRIKHGENSTGSEEADYSVGDYSYSYIGTDEGQDGSYRRGGNERSDKRRHGYKYKGGKPIKHGENSTSLEEADYSGGDYSYSYNGTEEGQEGSYRRGGKEKSDKRRHGYKYKGGKRYKHGENSTSSEDVDYSGGYGFSYNGSGLFSYNETENNNSAQDSKAKNGRRYKGRKQGYRHGGNSTNFGDFGSRSGGSYSNNGTWNETSASDSASGIEKLYKHKGHLRNGSRKDLNKANGMNGAKYHRRGKHQKEGKLRKKNGNAGGIGEVYSDEELDYGSGESSYNGSAATWDENDENGNGSQKFRNIGKKYRSGKYKVNGKYRNRKTNKGEREGINVNRTEELYEYYEDDEYNDGANDNETNLMQHANKSGTVRVKGRKYKTGKHRVGGKVNGTESNSSINNSTNGGDEYYYDTYYETYEDSNATESYDLGAEDQELSVDQAGDSQSKAGTNEEEKTGSGGAQENAKKSSASQLETSSDSGSGYWREEWTEAPIYGEYSTWEKEYEGEEYEVTDQPAS